MNEEEKKAICELKNYISRRKLKYTKLDRHDKSIYNLLNLLEKLQKENEELKKENEYNKLLLELNNNFTIDKKTGNYKWNVIEIQKIKDKIEELNKAYEDSKDENGESEYYYPDYTIRVLEELLESE